MTKELNIFGDIVSDAWADEDVTPTNVKKVIDGLKEGDMLNVNINCYGGEVFAAVAIANMLAASPATKTFNVLGICASAATMLFSGSDKVNISNGAWMMYHKPIGGVRGNANDMKKTIELLDKIESENIIKNLIARTKKPAEEIAQLVANEWWLTSDEAISNLGFAGTSAPAVINTATKQQDIYQNYLNKKKSLTINAFNIFTNIKKQLSK